MRTFLLILILIHGLLHILGFIKAFKVAELPQLTQPISRTNGVLWLIAALLVMSSGILFYGYYEWWWIVALISVILSEYVIIKDWGDARLGTVLNILILTISVIGYLFWRIDYY